MSEEEELVYGFRTAIQELLVPEFRAISDELRHQNEQFEIRDHFYLIQQEINEFRKEINKRLDAIEKEIENIH